MDLGPLPNFDDNAALQKASLAAFTNLIDLGRQFILRDERIMDYGVDASIEVVWNGHPTNFRAQVQIKSTASAVLDSAGACKLSIEVANVNYLLNGASALYVIYLADSGIFRFTWASDERKRLDNINPSWMKQKTVTLHFESVLDQNALAGIHQRIIDEARFHRQFSDLLSKHSLAESVKVSVDFQQRSIVDKFEAESTLIAAGFTLVTNGKWREVLHLHSLLSSDQSCNPKIRVVVAYALLSPSKYYQAYSEVAFALIDIEKLTLDEVLAAEEIRDVCAVQLGKLDRDVALQHQRERVAKTDPHTARLRQVDVKRSEFLSTVDLSEAKVKLDELEGQVRTLCNDDSFELPYKLQADIHLAYCSGAYINRVLTKHLAAFVIRRKMKSAVDETIAAVRATFLEMQRWSEHIQGLVTKGVATGNALLAAEAIRTFIFNQAALFHTAKFGSLQTGKAFDLDPSLIVQFEKFSEQAISMFQLSGSVHGELETKVLLAEVYELVGPLGKAHDIAGKVVPVADALGLHQIVERANDVLNANSQWTLLSKEFAKSEKRDQDIETAGWPDERNIEFARAVLENMDLPQDRFANVVEDVRNSQLAANERLHWCRHLELLQDLRHTGSWITKYALPCDYIAKCSHFGFETYGDRGKAGPGIELMKESHCRSCEMKSPKVL